MCLSSLKQFYPFFLIRKPSWRIVSFKRHWIFNSSAFVGQSCRSCFDCSRNCDASCSCYNCHSVCRSIDDTCCSFVLSRDRLCTGDVGSCNESSDSAVRSSVHTVRDQSSFGSFGSLRPRGRPLAGSDVGPASAAAWERGVRPQDEGPPSHCSRRWPSRGRRIWDQRNCSVTPGKRNYKICFYFDLYFAP